MSVSSHWNWGEKKKSLSGLGTNDASSPRLRFLPWTSLACWLCLFSDLRTAKQLMLPNPCLCFPTVQEAVFSPPGYCAWNSVIPCFERKEGPVSVFPVYLTHITSLQSSLLGLKFCGAFSEPTHLHSIHCFLSSLARLELSFSALWYNSIHFSILDYELTEGRDRIFISRIWRGAW